MPYVFSLSEIAYCKVSTQNSRPKLIFPSLWHVNHWKKCITSYLYSIKCALRYYIKYICITSNFDFIMLHYVTTPSVYLRHNAFNQSFWQCGMTVSCSFYLQWMKDDLHIGCSLSRILSHNHRCLELDRILWSRHFSLLGEPSPSSLWIYLRRFPRRSMPKIAMGECSYLVFK